MNYATYATQIDAIFKEGSRGGSDAFYEHLRLRLETLSKAWTIEAGNLSLEDLASLLLKKELCLVALHTKTRS